MEPLPRMTPTACMQKTRPFCLFLIALLSFLVGFLAPGTYNAAPSSAGQVQRFSVGFCNSDGSGFFDVQPDDQIERWQTPRDNGTHLEIDWKLAPRACGQNVSAYIVDVKTSTVFLNFFVDLFGRFPQDVCNLEGSKARTAVALEDGRPPNPCTPYPSFCGSTQRQTTFEIPKVLVHLTRLDIDVTIRAYGSYGPLNRPYPVPINN